MQPEWKNGLVKLSDWVLRLAWLNLLWIAFTLLGLVIAGFLPSTAAMFAVMRKWLKGNLETSVQSQFWFYFKKEFWKANAAGFLLVIAGYVLYFDIQVYEFKSGNFQQLLQVLVFVIAFVYLLTVVFFFPVYVHFRLKWYQYTLYSILVAFSYPFRALAMATIGYGVLYFITEFQGAVFFFLGSPIAYFWLLVSLPLFDKWENKNNEQGG